MNPNIASYPKIFCSSNYICQKEKIKVHVIKLHVHVHVTRHDSLHPVNLPSLCPLATLFCATQIGCTSPLICSLLVFSEASQEPTYN